MVDARAGHSVGEVAAAYAAGLYTLDEALAVALELGKAATLSGEGAMLHTRVKDVAEVETASEKAGLALAAVNAKDADGVSVSLCGPVAAVDAYVAAHDGAAKLAPKHAWHSPTLFAEASKGLAVKAPAKKAKNAAFRQSSAGSQPCARPCRYCVAIGHPCLTRWSLACAPRPKQQPKAPFVTPS